MNKQHESSDSVARMFHVWYIVVGMVAQKAMLNIGWVLSTFSCQYLWNE